MAQNYGRDECQLCGCVFANLIPAGQPVVVLGLGGCSKVQCWICGWIWMLNAKGEEQR
jgi:hypothetical protein